MQHVPAALFVGGSADRLLGPAADLLPVGVHPVPVEVGHQLCGPLLVGLVAELGFQEFLIFHEDVLGQHCFKIQAMLDPVEPLLGAQVKEVVDADAEDLRQHRQGADVRHGHGVFPLGDGLRADPQLFRQLLLGQAGLEAKLFDFLSQFHKKASCSSPAHAGFLFTGSL